VLRFHDLRSQIDIAWPTAPVVSHRAGDLLPMKSVLPAGCLDSELSFSIILLPSKERVDITRGEEEWR
jgi:hypothetical protein